MRNIMQLASAHRRSIVFFAAVLALVTLFVLASGLESVDLQPGEMYVMAEEEIQETEAGGRRLLVVAEGEPGSQLLAAFLLVAMVVGIFTLYTRKDVKKAAINVLRLGLQLFLVYLLIVFFNRPADIPEENVSPPLPLEISGDVDTFRPVEYVAPDTPQWFVFGFSFAVILAAGLGGWLAWRFLRPQEEPALQQELARIARRTLRDLEDCEDWGDAVIRCYVEMSEALNLRHGIYRTRSMTPNEFIQHVSRSSLPLEPVRALTRLFEHARYGGRSSGPKEAYEAVRCLNQIIEACEAKP
jgi:hypothetical protein